MELWIARNRCGIISLYTKEPEYNATADEWRGYDFEQIELSQSSFTEITFENSPQKVKFATSSELLTLDSKVVKGEQAQIASIFDLSQGEDNFAKRWAELKDEPGRIVYVLNFEARHLISPLLALAVAGWLFSVDISGEFTEERGREIYQWLIKNKAI